MSDRIYEALILNEPYAQWVKEGKKKIETRMKEFSFRGDIVICCDGGKSKSENAGNAICIVELYKVRDMLNTDIKDACIGNETGRKAYLLRNWRHFSRDFKFSKVAVKKNFQGIFSVRIPDDVEIIPMPDIKPAVEMELGKDFATEVEYIRQFDGTHISVEVAIPIIKIKQYEMNDFDKGFLAGWEACEREYKSNYPSPKINK